jgi:curli biogenesis system outer membrane secretion channel CsgG/RNA polymerase subunit RPABC4/transcription elongation factor Spt4
VRSAKVGAVPVMLALLVWLAACVRAQEAEPAGAQPAGQGPPRFPDVVLMIVVPERIAGYEAAAELTSAETELVRGFLAAGYKVVDQAQVAAVRDWGMAEEIMRNPAGPQARALADKHGAGLLIIGHALAERGGQVQGLFTARGRVEVRALVPSTGAVIFSDGVTESGADTTETFAAKKALTQAAARLLGPLLAAVGQATGGPTQPVTGGPAGPTGLEAALQSGRKIRVAVAPFDDKSGWTGGNWNLREAIPDLIAQQLMKLGIVDVVDRVSLSQTLAEQQLDVTGLVDRSEEPRELGTLQAADVLVVGRVSEFASKKQTVGGAIPWKIGGGLHREKGVVKILLKVLDVKTGRVLGMGEATGEATEVAVVGGYAGIVFGGAEFDKTAMGRATRKAVAEAVKKITGALSRAGLAVRSCPKCGAPVAAEARFCPQCGSKLGPPAGEATCPECGAKLPAGAKFCPQCGAKVGE